MSVSPSRPAIPWYGSKFNLAPWIVSHFPVHHTYVEPFGGAANVLVQKPQSALEVYNDIDSQVVNFFRVLRDAAARSDLISRLELTPYSFEEYHNARIHSADLGDAVEAARMFFVRGWQGFGSVGASTDLTNGWRRDKGTRRRKYNEEIARWLGAIPNLAEFGERFAYVQIDHDSVWDVVARYDSPHTLFYLDPPYLESTLTASKHYRTRFSHSDHRQLKFLLDRIAGFAIVSGYPSELYDSLYADWHRVERPVLTAGTAPGGTRSLRTEVLWLNPRVAQAGE